MLSQSDVSLHLLTSLPTSAHIWLYLKGHACGFFARNQADCKSPYAQIRVALLQACTDAKLLEPVEAAAEQVDLEPRHCHDDLHLCT